MIVVVGYRFGRARAALLGALIVAPWVLLRLIVGFIDGSAPWEDLRDLNHLIYGNFSAGRIGPRYSSLSDLIYLPLLGYLSGWLFTRLRQLVADAGLSLQELWLTPTAAETKTSWRLILMTLAAIVVIGLSNFQVVLTSAVEERLRFLVPISSLAVVMCVILSYRLGPQAGRLASVGAMIGSIVGSIFLVSYREIRLQFYQWGHLVSFGLIGFWAGRIGLIIPRPSSTLYELGMSLSLFAQNPSRIRLPVLVFIPFLLLFALGIELNVPLLEQSSLRVYLDPLLMATVILMGICCGARRAAWATGLSLGMLLVCAYAGMYGFGRWYEIGDRSSTFISLRFFQLSAADIGLWTLSAYVAGKLELADSRRNRYLLIIAIFVAFELSNILLFGSILSPHVSVRIDLYKLDVLTNMAKLLEPWFIAMLLTSVLKRLAGGQSDSEMSPPS